MLQILGFDDSDSSQSHITSSVNPITFTQFSKQAKVFLRLSRLISAMLILFFCVRVCGRHVLNLPM